MEEIPHGFRQWDILGKNHKIKKIDKFLLFKL